ncbi:MAG: hypothetical protein ABIR39_18715 [Nocardioides sp.]|uniref:PepSY domain-containing protein n=1 Tax=Nocardioides sp. TaxID=35761 RepID=UPI003264D3C0
MNRKKIALTGGAAAALVLAAGGAAIAGSGDDDASDTPIPGPALQQASDAALAETGGGTVTGTEVGDEESYYEVEVTLDNGDQVDVQLDEGFNVVGSETDSESETDD